jgi:hypothetical protein
MSLATRGYDEFRKVAGEPHAPATKDRAEQPADEIDKSIAEMGRAPTLIAVVWLAFYVVIAFAAWAH